MAFSLTVTTSFPRVFFQLLQFSRQRLRISAHMAALITRTDLIFPAFLFCSLPTVFLEILLTNFLENFKKKKKRGPRSPLLPNPPPHPLQSISQSIFIYTRNHIILHGYLGIVFKTRLKYSKKLLTKTLRIQKLTL